MKSNIPDHSRGVARREHAGGKFFRHDGAGADCRSLSHVRHNHGGGADPGIGSYGRLVENAGLSAQNVPLRIPRMLHLSAENLYLRGDLAMASDPGATDDAVRANVHSLLNDDVRGGKE